MYTVSELFGVFDQGLRKSASSRARNGRLHGDNRNQAERKKGKKKKAKYGLNALRHFCASLWIESNYDPKRVQTLMGHASIKQTYDTYGYLFELRKADVDALKQMQDRVLMV